MTHDELLQVIADVQERQSELGNVEVKAARRGTPQHLYASLAVDGTGFWRPRLRGCPTTHGHGMAGRALPAIPLGLIAGVGGAGA